MYNLICLIGEAGSGKDTVLRKVLAAAGSQVHKVINTTTRLMREGETNGVDYNFITVEEFSDKIINDTIIAAECFNGWFYGTEINMLDENKINIGIFNPAAIETLIEYKDKINLWVYYIEASEKNRLIRQLNREENPDIDEIIRRLKTDREDFYDLQFYYNILENNTYDDLNNAVQIILLDIFRSTQIK